MHRANSILEHIGRTPLVSLNRISAGLPVPVLVKCEHLNPGGSIKDRAALAIVRDAEERGLLRPGMTIIVLADPIGSALADWVETGTLGTGGAYAVEGVGASEVPENLHRDVIDSAERVSDDESFAMAKRLAREEGLFVGGSAGTNVVAAVRLAQRGDLDGPVVTVLPDSWDRYRAKPWMQEWML